MGGKAGARQVQKINLKHLPPVRFPVLLFFSLFSINLFYNYLIKINHLHAPHPPKTCFICKLSPHKNRDKLSVTPCFY